MKTIKLRHLLPEAIEEAHQQGDWWIDNAGELKPYKENGYYDDNDLMEHDKWKHMKASGDKIEVTTWELRAEDLRMIIKGIKGIMNQDPNQDTTNDPDATLGKDGYAGPRVDLTLAGKKKQFKNVPLGILEKCLPSRMRNYEKGKNPELAGPEELQESYHHLHKEYRLYEGNRHIVAIFEDNSRLVFEVHFHEKRGEDKEKWRRRAFSKWKSCANEIRRESQTLNEAGNPTTKSWKQCFEEALKHPKLQEFVRDPKKHKRVYPVMDPVNFTPRV